MTLTQSRPAALASSNGSSTADTRSKHWLESPAWDGVFLLNVVWLAPLLALAWAVGRESVLLAGLLKLGVLFLWGGHLISPVVAAWRSRELRAHMRKDPGRWIVRPVAFLLGGVGLGLLGLVGLDGGDARALAYAALLVTFVLWNTWHFTGQHFGVLSIYRQRSGSNDPTTRRMDRLYTVACTFVLVPVAWYLQSERIGPLFRVLPEPDASGVGRVVVIGASVTLCGFMLLREWRLDRPSLGRVGMLLTVGAQPALAAVSYPIFNFVLFSLSHWIVALALSSRILASYPRPAAPEGGGSLPRFVVAFGVLVLSSAPLYLLFWSDRVVAGTRYLINDVFRRGSELPAEAPSVLLALVVGGYFGLTFVHFLYDRALYGFRRAEVRTSVAPFLFAPLRGIDQPR